MRVRVAAESTIPLMTLEEIDEATRISVGYHAQGT